MMVRQIESVQLSERTTIKPKDRIRLRGGPTHGKMRVGRPGVYVVRSILTRRNRVYVTATQIDKQGMPCGTYTLFIQGKPYKSRLVATIVERPYRVSKVRSK